MYLNYLVLETWLIEQEILITLHFILVLTKYTLETDFNLHGKFLNICSLKFRYLLKKM